MFFVRIVFKDGTQTMLRTNGLSDIEHYLITIGKTVNQVRTIHF